MPNIETDVSDHEAAGNWAFVSLYGRILTQHPRAIANFTSIPIPKLLDQIHLPPTAGKKNNPSAVGRDNKEQFKWPGGEKIQTNGIFLFLLTLHGSECVGNFSISIQLTNKKSPNCTFLLKSPLEIRQSNFYRSISLGWFFRISCPRVHTCRTDEWPAALGHSLPCFWEQGNVQDLWVLSSE